MSDSSLTQQTFSGFTEKADVKVSWLLFILKGVEQQEKWIRTRKGCTDANRPKIDESKCFRPLNKRKHHTNFDQRFCSSAQPGLQDGGMSEISVECFRLFKRLVKASAGISTREAVKSSHLQRAVLRCCQLSPAELSCMTYE